MSLTSYRTAPPRVTEHGGTPCRIGRRSGAGFKASGGPVADRKEKILLKRWIPCVWQTWQRPTLPRLETKYHQRWGVSRPSSEWDRVQPPRHNHQVGETHGNAQHSRSWNLYSFGQYLWAQAMGTIKPIELLVPVSYMRCRTSTPGLSTWSSTTTLREYSFSGGFPA